MHILLMIGLNDECLFCIPELGRNFSEGGGL